MLSYKQPKLWIAVASVVLVLVVAVCFLTNPVSANEPNEPTVPPNGEDTAGAATEKSGGGDTNPGGLSKEKESEIKQAFLKQENLELECSVDELQIQLCGVFDGAYVMFVRGGLYYKQMACEETVGGILFEYANGNKLRVYHNGHFYNLQAAYEQGLLTTEDLGILRENDRIS